MKKIRSNTERGAKRSVSVNATKRSGTAPTGQPKRGVTKSTGLT